MSPLVPSQPATQPRSLISELVQAGKGILKAVAWVFLIVIACGLALAGYESYESSQPVDHDTPVWIQGDWLAGEFRVCQMRTKAVPEQRKDLDSLTKLPRLFCGNDANGLFDFQRQIALPSDTPAPAPGEMYFVGVTTEDLDGDFHVLPVSYFGSIKTARGNRTGDQDFIYDYDRTDKWVISWRCQRNTQSLTCKALD